MLCHRLCLIGMLLLTHFSAYGGSTVPALADRGLVAVEQGEGNVFLSWRYDASDKGSGPYRIIRTIADQPKATRKSETTCLTDSVKAKSGTQVDYVLKINGKVKGRASIEIQGKARPYINIPLNGDYDFQKATVADLDGDGAYEFLIRQPNFNTDPYQKPGYWKKSTTTYKIEAYEQDGTLMWRHDMGWSIEAGIWYAPWVVYDMDGDGRAEVYCKGGEGDPRDEKGLVQSGPEYLLKLDGKTGKVLKKVPWLSRDKFTSYNYYSRNFLGIAYLDGTNPSLIMERGTYKIIKVSALNANLERLWDWDSAMEKKTYGGQGAHNLTAADVDRDGRDELVIGAAVLDEYGKGLWSLEMGHPDFAYVADVDPDHPGLEIAYGFEKKQEKNGICLVDAKTGTILWGHQEQTFHIHSQGMAANVLSQYPGMEIWGGERDFPRRWLYSAKGERIEFHEKGALAPRPMWWDGDMQKEVAPGKAIHQVDAPLAERSKKHRDIEGMEGNAIQGLDGKVVLVADILGDWREEVVVALKGTMRIYTSPIPTDIKRTPLMTNRQYRLSIATQTSGYYCPAQLDELPQY